MDVKEPPKEHLNTKQILCPPFPLHPITRVTTPFRHPQVSRPWRECRSAHGSESCPRPEQKWCQGFPLKKKTIRRREIEWRNGRTQNDSHFHDMISGWWLQPTPLKNHGVRNSWGYDIPNIWKIIKHVPNHQPDYCAWMNPGDSNPAFQPVLKSWDPRTLRSPWVFPCRFNGKSWVNDGSK